MNVLLDWLRDVFLDPSGVVRREVAYALLPGTTAALLAVAAWLYRQPLRAFVRGMSGRWRERRRPGWDNASLANVRSDARILVIDDERFAHYEQLADRGFAIETWTMVDKQRARSIDQAFDLLILDVKGVRDAFGADDGIAALDLLRHDNPWIPILVYTSYLGDLQRDRKKELRRHAQASLEKHARYSEFEKQVTEWLAQERTPGYFTERLQQLGLESAESLVAAISRGESPEKLPLPDGTALQQNQWRAVLKIADDVRHGQRWTTRTLTNKA